MKKFTCPTCEHEFVLIKDDHYVVEAFSRLIGGPRYFDAWDCPVCGGQCRGNERYLEFEEEEKQRGDSSNTIIIDEFETKDTVEFMADNIYDVVNIICAMRTGIAKHGVVTSAEILKIFNHDLEPYPQYYKEGWFDIDGFAVTRVDDEYRVTLPKPQPIK